MRARESTAPVTVLYVDGEGGLYGPDDAEASGSIRPDAARIIGFLALIRERVNLKAERETVWRLLCSVGAVSLV